MQLLACRSLGMRGFGMGNTKIAYHHIKNLGHLVLKKGSRIIHDESIRSFQKTLENYKVSTKPMMEDSYIFLLGFQKGKKSESVKHAMIILSEIVKFLEKFLIDLAWINNYHHRLL